MKRRRLYIVALLVILLIAGLVLYFVWYRPSKDISQENQKTYNGPILETANLEELSKLPAEERISRTISLAITKFDQEEVDEAKHIFENLLQDTELGDNKAVVLGWLYDIAVFQNDTESITYWQSEIGKIEASTGTKIISTSSENKQ